MDSPKLVAILANPHAGTGPSGKLLDRVVSALYLRGFSARVCRQREELADLLSGNENRVRCVIAAGGDGTFNEAMNRAPGVPLAVLPVGNENLVAKHFGYRRSGDWLANVIAAGREQQIDVGRLNGRRFALMAGAGFDADVVHRVHHNRKGHVGKLNYAWQIGQAARGYSFPPIDVEVTDTGEKLCGPLVFVFNLPRYGVGLPIARGADPTDGLLDLYVFERPRVVNLLRYFAAVMTRRHHRLPDVKHRRVHGVRLRSDAQVPVQTDGDPVGFLPATVDVLPGAVTMITR
jgi:diacylglycerol kinase family enzyme